MEIQLALIDAIREADRQGANALLDGWAAEHGYDRLLSEVLDPALVMIGDEWNSTGTVTISQAYVAAKVAEDMMNKILELGKRTANAVPAKGPVVIGNIEEDFHALGRKMVGTFLRADGWIVHDLGNDTPAATFVDKALEVGARIIGVSAMMMTTARNIKLVRNELNSRGLSGRIQLAVGGSIFRVCPDLVEEVGGDGTAENALGAVGLFDQLWHRSIQREQAA